MSTLAIYDDPFADLGPETAGRMMLRVQDRREQGRCEYCGEELLLSGACPACCEVDFTGEEVAP